ncbi:MAG: hypothetical protein ACI9TY_000106 [Alphaproteobacteria bacterium]|jgi:hypothetical protein
MKFLTFIFIVILPFSALSSEVAGDNKEDHRYACESFVKPIYLKHQKVLKTYFTESVAGDGRTYGLAIIYTYGLNGWASALGLQVIMDAATQKLHDAAEDCQTVKSLSADDIIHLNTYFTEVNTKVRVIVDDFIKNVYNPAHVKPE